jgi:hypothetical protein
MMKGVICEIKGRESVALFTDGKFRKVPTPENAITGTVINVYWNKKLYTALLAGALVLLAGIITAAALYFSTAGFLDITYGSKDDVQVIVELAYNRYERILEVSGFTQDAAQSLKSLEPDSKNLEKGYADVILAAALLPAKKPNKKVHVSVRISDRDTNRAEGIKERLLSLTEQLEKDGGRRLSLTCAVYHLGLQK